MNIKQAIDYGIKELKCKETPRSYCLRILQVILKVNQQYLIVNEKEEMSQKNEKEYINKIEKVKAGVPLQYVTNSQQFMGLDFYVNENVLIPQPDTEVLVEEVIKLAKENNLSRILDMCTGSGAIGISIANYLENVKITMSDISEKALKIAQKNAIQNNVYESCELIHSDLFENINAKYDMIVSNPPYIESDEISRLSKEVQNEPKLALDGGKDGLVFYRKIINHASEHLNNNGYLALELGYNQSKQVKEIIEASGKFLNSYFVEDIQNIKRVVIARKR